MGNSNFFLYHKWQITHESTELGLSFLFRHIDTTHLCMKFHVFISSSSLVMAPGLKTRPRTDGLGDDSARAVLNRTAFVESFTLQVSRKGTLAFISR